MQVTARETATGKRNNITITNDQSRLTKEEIARMIAEAERFREHDQEVRVAIAARNDLESYIYQMKSLINDAAVVNKISESEKSKILKKCINLTTWLSENDSATEKDYVMKKSELEKLCKPVVLRLYTSNTRDSRAERQFPNSQNDNGNGGPSIEEVD